MAAQNLAPGNSTSHGCNPGPSHTVMPKGVPGSPLAPQSSHDNQRGVLGGSVRVGLSLGQPKPVLGQSLTPLGGQHSPFLLAPDCHKGHPGCGYIGPIHRQGGCGLSTFLLMGSLA